MSTSEQLKQLLIKEFTAVLGAEDSEQFDKTMGAIASAIDKHLKQNVAVSIVSPAGPDTGAGTPLPSVTGGTLT